MYEADAPANPHPYQNFDGVMGELDVTHEEVLEVLSSQDGSSFTGPEGLHPMVSKSCAVVIALPLTLIFKKSPCFIAIPKEWRQLEKVAEQFSSYMNSS